MESGKDKTNSLQNTRMNQKPISTIDLTQRNNRRIINTGSGFITIIVMLVFAFLLDNAGYPAQWLLLVLAILIPLTIIHEYCHFIFQWLFSGNRPHLGWKSMFPYSALATSARTTRNQGIICALAPLLTITPALVLLSMLFNPLPKLILLASASVEVASCFGDLFQVSWFIRHDRQLKWGRIGFANALFQDD